MTAADSEEQEGKQPIRERWGKALADGFLVVPTVMLRRQYDLGLTPGELNVLLNIMVSWRRDAELPFIQAPTMAKRMGISTRTVQRHIDGLIAKGLIARVARFEGPGASAAAESQGDRRNGRSTPDVPVAWNLSGLVHRLQALGALATDERKPAAELDAF